MHDWQHLITFWW